MTISDTNAYGLVAIAVILLSIGFFVLSKGFRRVVNRSFFVFAAGGALWALGIALIFLTERFVFDKLVHYGGLLFFLGFFLLAKSFTGARLRVSPWVLYAPIAIGAVGIIPWNLINEGMTVGEDGSISPIPGPLIVPHMAIISAYVAVAIAMLVKKFRRTAGRERRELLYLFLGTGIFMVTSVVFDAILPAFGVTSLIFLGPLSAVAFVGSVAYAILRHELMDIRIVIQRGLIYTLIFALIALLYAALMNVAALFFRNATDLQFLSTGIATTVIGVIGVPILERFFRKKTDRLFFKGRYDYAESLRELSKILYESVDLADLIRRSEASLASTLRAASIRIALQSKEDENSSLLPDDNKGSVLVVPIATDTSHVGSIFVGPKRSGDLYSEEDRKLVETFAYQAATAFSRAILFEEIKLYASELEKRVKERTRELEISHESQRQMMIDISHGLQTPLTVFQTKLEELKRALPGDTSIVALEKSLSRLSRFIYDLLELAELERESEAFEAEDIDLGIILFDAAEELRIIASAQGIALRTSIEQGVRIRGDDKRIREVISNLASNSMKYMRAEGPREVMISLAKRDGFAILRVRDTGIGIGEKDLESVFKRFYRTERALSLKVQGNGIGLAIARKIVEKHGGSISAQSILGEGTTMEVRIPAL